MLIFIIVAFGSKDKKDSDYKMYTKNVNKYTFSNVYIVVYAQLKRM